MSNSEDDESIALRFLTKEEVIILHRAGIERYTPGEPLDIISHPYLESALSQPQQTWGGAYVYESIAQMAAAYMLCLASNHAFQQGNKRVALAAASTFLRMNGYRLTLSEEQAENLILDIANKRVDMVAVAEILEDAIDTLN